MGKREQEEEIKIISARPEDAWGIVNVLHKTWLATYPNEKLRITVEDIEKSYSGSFTKENLAKLGNKIAQAFENEKRLVVKTGNDVVGVATVVRNRNNNELKTIYVLPEFQRRGIGTMLWEEVRKFCDPTKDIIVRVATYNQKTIEFYKKLGFVDTGKRFDTNAWRMKKIGIRIPEMEMVIRAKG